MIVAIYSLLFALLVPVLLFLSVISFLNVVYLCMAYICLLVMTDYYEVGKLN